MTSDLSSLVTGASVFLLDFDGPVCSVFAGHPASQIADELRGLVAKRGVELTGELATATGPHTMLRLVNQLGDPSLTQAVADTLRDAEVEAAATAAPTPGADALLNLLPATGRRAVIVSNNAPDAIRAYLDRVRLADRVALVVGRDPNVPPVLMKPHPHLLRAALDQVPGAALFIGDSVSDIDAGRAAGVPTVGYANKPGKHERLTAAGADAIVEHMGEFLGALLQPYIDTER